VSIRDFMKSLPADHEAREEFEEMLKDWQDLAGALQMDDGDPHAIINFVKLMMASAEASRDQGNVVDVKIPSGPNPIEEAIGKTIVAASQSWPGGTLQGKLLAHLDELFALRINYLTSPMISFSSNPLRFDYL